MENKNTSKPDNAQESGTSNNVSEILDINDQKNLIESEALLNSFFNSPGAMRGVVEVENDDIRHIADNFITAKFFGRTQASMVNLLASQMGVNKEFIDIWIKHYEKSKHTKQPITFEYEHKIDNQSLFFSVTVNYLGESIRGFSRYTYVLFDITELKKTQKALQKTHDELDKRIEQRTAELAQSNAQLKQEIEERKRSEEALKILNTVSQTVNETLELEQILNGSLDKVIELLKVDGGFIRLVDENKQKLVLTANKGFNTEQLCKLPISRKYGDGANWKALLADQVEYIIFNPNDPYQQKTNSFGLQIGAHSAILFPIKSKDKMLGTMSIYSFTPRHFTKHEVDLTINIGNQIGVAIENARLYQEKESTIQMLKETQNELQQAQKMEAIGTLAGGIAHDFNNILSAVIGYTELAFGHVEKGTQLEVFLQEIFTAGERAKDLVTQILTFARQTAKDLKPVQVCTIAKEALKLIRSTIPTTIEIRQNIESDSLILADPTQVHQIIINLCTNAYQAMEDEGGVLEISLSDVSIDKSPTERRQKIKPRDYLKLSVSDTGKGISKDIINSIFEPYFTTKETGKGTGMGLAMVHGIVTSYGGDITVESKIGKGTVFTVYLPITKKDFKIKANSAEEIPSGTERILFVDDELPIANMGRKALERLGYTVTIRTSSLEALELFKQKPTEFDLVITDMTMPNMTGESLAAEMMKIRPNLPIIICTGYSNKMSEERAAEIGISAFSMKPFTITDIAQTVRKVLDEAKSSA